MKWKLIIYFVGIIVTIYFIPRVAFITFILGWLFVPPIVIINLAARGFQEYRTSRKTTRNVSLEEEHIKILKPNMEKCNGNLSAAIREMINQNVSTKKTDLSESFLFRWMMKEVDGILLPDNILNEIIDPRLIDSMEKLKSFLRDIFIDWNVDISLISDINTSPSNVIIDLKGDNQKIKLVASLISQFLVKNSYKIPLRVLYVYYLERQIIVELSRSSRQDAIDSLSYYFGKTDEIYKAVKDRPKFWRSLINEYISSNYNMVMIHRNYFEDLFTNKTPMGEILIENLANKPICDIPLEEIFNLIKTVNETSGIIDRVEIDNENLILFHNYRDKDAIERLKNSFILLLKANGQSYEAKTTKNMILLNKIYSETENIEEIEILKINQNKPKSEEIII